MIVNTTTLTFLGTGTSQGVPVIGCSCEVCTDINHKNKRFRCSAVFSIGNQNLIIDIGPDFRQQCLRYNLDNFEAAFITHEHNDHTAGVDDIRPINFKYQKEISIYAQNRVCDNLKTRFSYAFDKNPYPGAPVLSLKETEFHKTIQIGDFLITPFPILHGKLLINGYKINDFVYITDGKTIPKESEKYVYNCDHLVLNALQKEAHHSHFTLDEAIEIGNKSQAKRVWLTHISHRLGTHHQVQKILHNSKFVVAYDGLKVTSK